MTAADAPSFEEWLSGKPQEQPKPRPDLAPVRYIGPAGGDPYANKALIDECAELAAMGPKTGRNNKLNDAAFRLGRFVQSGALTEQAVQDALIAACQTNGLWDDPEDGPASIEATIRSGLGGARTKSVVDVRTPLPDNIGNTTFDPSDTLESDTETDDAPPTATLEQIEDNFWWKRGYLTLIHDAALSRMASPWAVLACCMARALALVPPHITLPPIIGAEGSLNWFAAISAKSGGGKGAAMAVAEALMPQEVNVRGIGSGEGMIEVYQRSSGDKKDPPPPVTSVLFSIEEIDSLGAMGGRSGQTTMAILRQGFSGEKLGYSYRGRQGETVAKHTYRMTVVASVQPERAGVLFADAGGGTPQRFMWFPGRDKRITARPEPWPDGQIQLPNALEDAITESEIITGADSTMPLKSVRVPDAAAQMIRETRAQSMSGDDNALNSHALFCREKFAFGLALLDGRIDAISEDDWTLSGTAAAVSDWCRTKAHEGYLAGQQSQSRERGALRAHENDERSLVESMVYQKHIARIVALIVKHIEKHGPDTAPGLRRRQKQSDRPRFEAALTAAAESGVVVKQGDDKWALP